MKTDRTATTTRARRLEPHERPWHTLRFNAMREDRTICDARSVVVGRTVIAMTKKGTLYWNNGSADVWPQHAQYRRLLLALKALGACDPVGIDAQVKAIDERKASSERAEASRRLRWAAEDLGITLTKAQQAKLDKAETR